ncbi:HEAT repeat domain-containing protein [Armatimonas sp.]|uniref:HEAT repeat domain-containing protein n=1 Tax=Armatimonas sp. TaxID=1872638 RepID=UPI00286BC6B6|nr:HEAT repeat domain-containing protein [Armatimonas sp.]
MATEDETRAEALRGMADPDPRIRAYATGLLDHLATDACVVPLTKALSDPSAHVRRLAVHALGCQDCKAAPLDIDIVGLLVDRALHDKSIRVRRVTVHQLGLQPHDPRAVSALESILEHDHDEKLRSRAAFALKNQTAEYSVVKSR